MNRWFGPPRGAHRTPAPGTLLGRADQARGDAKAPTAVIPKVAPLADTRPFDAAELWTGPLPVRQPGASRPRIAHRYPLASLRDMRRLRDRIAGMGPSPVRDGVLVTARASSFRFGLRCYSCGREHRNLNADRFADLYASAAAAGFRQDLYGASWRCPRCSRRHNASFGAHPVAAIESSSSGGNQS